MTKGNNQKMLVVLGAAGLAFAWYQYQQQRRRDNAIGAALAQLPRAPGVTMVDPSSYEPGGANFVGPIDPAAYEPGGALFVGPIANLSFIDNADYIDPDLY